MRANVRTIVYLTDRSCQVHGVCMCCDGPCAHVHAKIKFAYDPYTLCRPQAKCASASTITWGPVEVVHVGFGAYTTDQGVRVSQSWEISFSPIARHPGWPSPGCSLPSNSSGRMLIRGRNPSGGFLRSYRVSIFYLFYVSVVFGPFPNG